MTEEEYQQWISAQVFFTKTATPPPPEASQDELSDGEIDNDDDNDSDSCVSFTPHEDEPSSTEEEDNDDGDDDSGEDELDSDDDNDTCDGNNDIPAPTDNGSNLAASVEDEKEEEDKEDHGVDYTSHDMDVDIVLEKGSFTEDQHPFTVHAAYCEEIDITVASGKLSTDEAKQIKLRKDIDLEGLIDEVNSSFMANSVLSTNKILDQFGITPSREAFVLTNEGGADMFNDNLDMAIFSH